MINSYQAMDYHCTLDLKQLATWKELKSSVEDDKPPHYKKILTVLNDVMLVSSPPDKLCRLRLFDQFIDSLIPQNIDLVDTYVRVLLDCFILLKGDKLRRHVAKMCDDVVSRETYVKEERCVVAEYVLRLMEELSCMTTRLRGIVICKDEIPFDKECIELLKCVEVYCECGFVTELFDAPEFSILLGFLCTLFSRFSSFCLNCDDAPTVSYLENSKIILKIIIFLLQNFNNRLNTIQIFNWNFLNLCLIPLSDIDSSLYEPVVPQHSLRTEDGCVESWLFNQKRINLFCFLLPRILKKGSTDRSLQTSMGLAFSIILVMCRGREAISSCLNGSNVPVSVWVESLSGEVHLAVLRGFMITLNVWGNGDEFRCLFEVIIDYVYSSNVSVCYYALQSLYIWMSFIPCEKSMSSEEVESYLLRLVKVCAMNWSNIMKPTVKMCRMIWDRILSFQKKFQYTTTTTNNDEDDDSNNNTSISYKYSNVIKEMLCLTIPKRGRIELPALTMLIPYISVDSLLFEYPDLTTNLLHLTGSVGECSSATALLTAIFRNLRNFKVSIQTEGTYYEKSETEDEIDDSSIIIDNNNNNNNANDVLLSLSSSDNNVRRMYIKNYESFTLIPVKLRALYPIIVDYLLGKSSIKNDINFNTKSSMTFKTTHVKDIVMITENNNTIINENIMDNVRCAICKNILPALGCADKEGIADILLQMQHRQSVSLGESALLNVARKYGIGEWLDSTKASYDILLSMRNSLKKDNVHNNTNNVTSSLNNNDEPFFCIYGYSITGVKLRYSLTLSSLEWALNSGNDAIKINLINFITTSKETCAKASPVELYLILHVCRYNLKQNELLRCEMASAICRFLTRLRDAYRRVVDNLSSIDILRLLKSKGGGHPSSNSSCIHNNNNNNNININNTDKKDIYIAPSPFKFSLEQAQSLIELFDFLSKLHTYLITWISPGCPFDRRETALSILYGLYQIWGVMPDTKTKTQYNGGCQVGLALGFYDYSIQLCLLNGLSAPWESQRNILEKILILFPSKNYHALYVNNYNNTNSIDLLNDTSAICRIAFHQLETLQTRFICSGSLLLGLWIRNPHLNHDINMNRIMTDEYILETLANFLKLPNYSFYKTNDTFIYSFLSLVLQTIQYRIKVHTELQAKYENFKKNEPFFKSENSVHGMIAGISSCLIYLKNKPFIYIFDGSKWKRFFLDFICALINALEIMSPKIGDPIPNLTQNILNCDQKNSTSVLPQNLNITTTHSTHELLSTNNATSPYNNVQNCLHVTEAWLTLKEISDCIANNVDLFYDKALSKPQLSLLNIQLIASLLASRHPGAIEKLANCVSKICEELLKKGANFQLADEWIDVLCKEMMDSYSRLPYLRKSRCLSAAFVSILVVDPPPCRLLRKTMAFLHSDLFENASLHPLERSFLPQSLPLMATDHTGDTKLKEEGILNCHSNSKIVQRLNVLRAIHLNSKLVGDTNSNLLNALHLCLYYLQSPDWSIRSSASLLFASVSKRFNRVADETKKVNKSNNKLEVLSGSFMRNRHTISDFLTTGINTYPQLSDQLQSILTKPSTAALNAALTLLPSILNIETLTSNHFQIIKPALAHPHINIRIQTAKVFVYHIILQRDSNGSHFNPLLPFATLSSRTKSANESHGNLLVILEYIKRRIQPSDEFFTPDERAHFVRVILSCWTSKPPNNCYPIRIILLQIFSSLLSFFLPPHRFTLAIITDTRKTLAEFVLRTSLGILESDCAVALKIGALQCMTESKSDSKMVGERISKLLPDWVDIPLLLEEGLIFLRECVSERLCDEVWDFCVKILKEGNRYPPPVGIAAVRLLTHHIKKVGKWSEDIIGGIVDFEKAHKSSRSVRNALVVLRLTIYPLSLQSEILDDKVKEQQEEFISDSVLKLKTLVMDSVLSSRMEAVSALESSNLLIQASGPHQMFLESQNLLLWNQAITLLGDEIPEVRKAMSGVCVRTLKGKSEVPEKVKSILEDYCLKEIDAMICVELVFELLTSTLDKTVTWFWLISCISRCESDIRRVCRENFKIDLPKKMLDLLLDANQSSDNNNDMMMMMMRMQNKINTPTEAKNNNTQQHQSSSSSLSHSVNNRTAQRVFDVESQNPLNDDLLIAQLATRTFLRHHLNVEIPAPFIVKLPTNLQATTKRKLPFPILFVQKLSTQLSDANIALQTLSHRRLLHGTAETWRTTVLELGDCTFDESLFVAFSGLLLKAGVLLEVISHAPYCLEGASVSIAEVEKRIIRLYQGIISGKSRHPTLLRATSSLAAVWGSTGQDAANAHILQQNIYPFLFPMMKTRLSTPIISC